MDEELNWCDDILNSFDETMWILSKERTYEELMLYAEHGEIPANSGKSSYHNVSNQMQYIPPKKEEPKRPLIKYNDYKRALIDKKVPKNSTHDWIIYEVSQVLGLEVTKVEGGILLGTAFINCNKCDYTKLGPEAFADLLYSIYYASHKSEIKHKNRVPRTPKPKIIPKGQRKIRLID
jgi:hypothetical protein